MLDSGDMVTNEVTISLANDQLTAIRKLVTKGKAANVSSFVRHAVSVALADVAEWDAMLARALDRTGGPLTTRERAWANSVLGVDRSRGTRRKAQR